MLALHVNSYSEYHSRPNIQQKQTDRQTDRQIEIQIENQELKVNRPIDRPTHRETYRHADMRKMGNRSTTPLRKVIRQMKIANEHSVVKHPSFYSASTLANL